MISKLSFYNFFLNIFKYMGEIGYKIRFGRPLETNKIWYSIIVIGTAYMSLIPTLAFKSVHFWSTMFIEKNSAFYRQIIIHIASRDNSFDRFFL